MDISRTNEGYTSCGSVVEMSWHRAGVLLLGAQSCLSRRFRPLAQFFPSPEEELLEDEGFGV
uniref:Uncharacterized protein n=1 Tax=Oryza nivara TaxID=4536 RepID=A0A679BB62_ORYNI|nr:hypothetical protein [Oryza sativa f. spontanea]